MNRQRKVLITITYNEMGIIIDTKAEELNLSAQPEIIRCRDCKWYNDKERTCNDLMGFGRYWKPDDFCSYGKRRTDE